MDVSEVKEKIRELESRIAELLGDFEEDTGANVSCIECSHNVCYDNCGGKIYNGYKVEIEVSLL